MAVAEEILKNEQDGSISFGNHKLTSKAKADDFKHGGDILKCKTYNEITKLEKNGGFLYESVPGTTVSHFTETEDGIEFAASADADAQITVGLKEDTDYNVFVNDEKIGTMKTVMGGKLSLSVELEGNDKVSVKILQA